MFNKVLDALNLKNRTKLNGVLLFNYSSVYSVSSDIYCVNTSFKYNFKYYITLMVNQCSVFYFNFSSKVSCDLNQLKSRDSYATQNFMMIYFLSYLMDLSFFDLYFFYKNVSFTHFVFLKDFFKMVAFSGLGVKTPELFLFFNFGLSSSLSSYLKKVKTSKKFKKKMFYKEFLFNYKDVFL